MFKNKIRPTKPSRTLFDRLMAEAVDDVVCAQIEQTELPPELLSKIIKQTTPKPEKPEARAMRRLAFAAIAVVVMATAALGIANADAVIETIQTIFYVVTEDYTGERSVTSDAIPLEIAEKIQYPEYMSEGFRLGEVRYDDGGEWIYLPYFNEADWIIITEKTKTKEEQVYTASEGEEGESIIVGNIQGESFIGMRGEAIISWKTDQTWFVLKGNIAMEELLKIAGSIPQ